MLRAVASIRVRGGAPVWVNGAQLPATVPSEQTCARQRSQAGKGMNGQKATVLFCLPEVPGLPFSCCQLPNCGNISDYTKRNPARGKESERSHLISVCSCASSGAGHICPAPVLRSAGTARALRSGCDLSRCRVPPAGAAVGAA